MGSKINTSYWGSNVSPYNDGTHTFSYGISSNAIINLIANGVYSPNADSFDYSVSPWGIGYSAAGNRGQIAIQRQGSVDGNAPGVITKISFEGIDRENTNRPFYMPNKGAGGMRDNYNWIMARVGGDCSIDSNNRIIDNYNDQILAGNSASSDCISNQYACTFLNYQHFKLAIRAFNYINLDTGVISQYRFADDNVTPENAKTKFDNYNFPEHMAITTIYVSPVGYAMQVGSPTQWTSLPTPGYYGLMQMRGHTIGDAYLFNKIGLKATADAKYKLFAGWNLGAYGVRDTLNTYYTLPRNYYTSRPYVRNIPVEGADYRPAPNGINYSLVQVDGLGVSPNSDYDTTFVSNYCDKEQSFADIKYSQRPLLYTQDNGFTEIKEGYALSTNSGQFRATSIYEVSGSNTFTKAQILALIKHEVAFYGFEFYIGWGNANGGTFTVGSDDLYLPKFDEHLITTGMYTSGTASLSEPNATWGNVFDDSMPKYDSEYNPNPHPGPGGGGMDIGGSQTNYPNGLTGHNHGGVYNGTDGNSMYQGNSALRGTVENAIALSMSGKIYCIDGQMLSQAINALNHNSLIQATARNIIQEIYGANVYDGITMCRMYPFDLEGAAYAQIPYVYGVYPLLELEDGVPKPGQYYFWICNKYAYQFDMGYVVPPIEQAWEIENIEYSIYLPFAGTYPIDIRSSEIIRVYLNVDVFSGLGEYAIYQGAQLTHCFKVNLGWDIPINLSRGEMLQNLYTTTQNAIAKTIGVGSTALGVATGNPLAGMAGNMAAQSMMTSEHWAVTAPQIGGIAGLFSYPKCRLICKIPKMFNDATGYNELLGANRSTGYEALNSCSGFVKCKNYKCDIIVATSDEKAEIERLMDAGVFI